MSFGGGRKLAVVVGDVGLVQMQKVEGAVSRGSKVGTEASRACKADAADAACDFHLLGVSSRNRG